MTKNLLAFGFADSLKSDLERLLTIQADLRRTVSCLKMLVPPSPLMREAGVIGMALHTQAIVSYTRCFTSGRRKGLSPKIYALKPDLLAFHLSIKDLRDKHISHSVGNNEHCNVLVAAKDVTSPAAGLGVRYWFFVGGGGKHMRDFLRLTEYARRHVANEVTSTGNALAKKMLGSNASWSKAQRAFYQSVSEESVYGKIQHED